MTKLTELRYLLDGDNISFGSVDNATLGFISDPRRHHHFVGVVYAPLKAPDYVTGIRANNANSDSVVITGSTVLSNGETVASVYAGSLHAVPNAPASKWQVFQPAFSGESVTGSTLYGPNTALFDPSLGAGNIRAVGSYKYTEATSGPETDHGMIYQGALNGTGTWTQIDADPLVAAGTLLNTIPHSTMGNLVVGNYDTNLATGHAFIYDTTGSWAELNPTNSLSATAYGIWQNGGSNSTHYTIAGGFSDLNHGGVDKGYVVDYDSASKTLSHLQTYNFDDRPISSLISHFDGITATDKGFNLTGEYVDYDHGGAIGGFFASIERLPDGSFSKADWTSIAFPNADLTTGNTVIGNTVLGLYSPGQTAEISSYIATVLH